MRAHFLQYIFLFLLVGPTYFRTFRKPNQELLYQTTFWCGLVLNGLKWDIVVSAQTSFHHMKCFEFNNLHKWPITNDKRVHSWSLWMYTTLVNCIICFYRPVSVVFLRSKQCFDSWLAYQIALDKRKAVLIKPFSLPDLKATNLWLLIAWWSPDLETRREAETNVLYPLLETGR